MKKILVAIGISLILFFIAQFGFSTQHAILIALIGLMVTLWTNEALPLGVVSLFPILLFPMFDILDTNATASNYSKSIIFLFLGGFMIAIATQKIGLHKVVAHKLLSIFPNTQRGVIFSLSITSAFLSAVISNTTTALLLIPIAIFLAKDIQLKARFVLAIAYGASIGGIMTPIGTPPNLILLGFLQDRSIEMVSFVKWMGLTMPLAIFMLIIIPFILSLGTSKYELDHSALSVEKVTKEQKRLLYILLSLVILLLVNSPIKPYYNGLGLSEQGILLGYGLLMFMPKIGFLQWSDSKNIPYEIIFLFGAGFSIANAFSHTGLAQEIANNLLFFTSFEPFIVILLVASLITFTTEVTSNTALISIALPIIYALGEASNVDTGLLLMTATICASYAFMLPIATPPNAIALSSGVIKIKQMAGFGFLFNILGIFAITVTALYYWAFFL